MSNIPYRILSLDGNGSWTLVQVRALQEIYGKDATGHDVLQYFDLVAANSGGSLVTALLAANWPLAKILSVFLDTPTRTRLFVKLSSMARLTNVIRQGARYSTRQKYQGLASFSGVDWATPLDQLADRVSIALGKPIHFLFTASDCDRRELVIFRSNLVSKAAAAGYSVSIRLIDAIHASTTSPFSYFDEPTAAASREFSGRRFVGSDLSSVTNPILTAVTEILANRDSKIIRPMEILSIGSGSLALPVSLMADQKPPLYRAQESGSLAVTDETAADVSTYTAHLIATQPVSGSTETGTLIRLNPLIQPGFDYSGNARVPSIMGTTEASLKAFTALLKIDQSALDADDVDLVLKFCDAWINGAMANQSIRANAKYECEIGYAKFEDAKAAWIRRVPLKAPISVAKSASAKLSSTNVVPATAMSAAESVTDTIASSSFPTSAATAPLPPPTPPPVLKARKYQVWYATNRKPRNFMKPSEGFTGELDRQVHYGRCGIEVPAYHQFASIGSVWIKKLSLGPATELTLRTIDQMTNESFHEELISDLTKDLDIENSMLVFLHGHRTEFHKAALQAAQLGLDLKLPHTSFFSWPSQGTADGYSTDVENIEKSGEAITEFLFDLLSLYEASAGIGKIHIVAQDLGCRALLKAVERVTHHLKGSKRRVKFGHIIFTAPDVDAEQLQQSTDSYSLICERATLYSQAGSDDAAASDGSVSVLAPATVAAAIDVVETAGIELTTLGHRFDQKAEPILYDMAELIHFGAPPNKRTHAKPSDPAAETARWKIEIR